MPRCLVLCGHPLDPSFAAALAGRYAEVMAAWGVEVRRLDLAGLAVPPTLSTRLPGPADRVGDIARVWDDMVWADHLALVYPLWWGGMPAKLKALVDIVLQAGAAYDYEGSNPLPRGLLAPRSARVVVTSDTPGWFMALAYGNAPFRTVRQQILGFVGFRPVALTHLSVMRHNTPAQRERMLERVAAVARRDAERLRKRKMAT